MNELRIHPIRDERERHAHMAPPDYLMGKRNLLGGEVGKEHGNHVADRRPCAPRVVRADDAKSLDRKTAQADDEQQYEHDDVAGLRIELLVHDAPDDAGDHGDAERQTGKIDGKRHEVQVEITVDKLKAQVELRRRDNRGDEHDDHADIHSQVHNARTGFLQDAKLQKRVGDHALRADLPIARSIHWGADRHEAPTLHQEVDAETERNQEEQIHYPGKGMIDIPHYLTCCCVFHNAFLGCGR